VLVSGEVVHPQSYPIYGPTRLLDVLVQAGGLGANAGSFAIITRGEIGAHADAENPAEFAELNAVTNGDSFALDIRKLMQTGQDKTNILLYPGDRITIQRAALIYVIGAVNRPGGYVLNESRQGITALKALAEAGDVTNIAKRDKIVILRRSPSGGPEKRDEVAVNYKAILKGQTPDIRLKADDILFVPESTRIKAMHTLETTAVTVATGTGTALIIYH
jgi:polysaccharide export outer membrane protein